MATKRLTMYKTREILRQKWELGCSHRTIARSLGIGLAAVSRTSVRAQNAGLNWEKVQLLDDEALENYLYQAAGTRRCKAPRAEPDCRYIHRERRKPGVTLELLHQEYLEHHSDGYRYTQYCQRYRSWLKKRGLTMRQVHRAGEKMFIDYSGKGPSLVDRKTGEVKEIELFVATLGASSYTYAEASRTQQSHDFIASHTRAIEFFEGVAKVTVPDQLKSAVTRSCRYEPSLNRTYSEWGRHVGTAIVPARPKKPKDKAKVEVAVQVAQRWILARLRNQTFFSLSELNQRIGELLEDLNSRTMRHLGKSRRELYEELDRPALGPLPSTRFQYATWKRAKVNIDYHIEVEKHYYSVPHAFAREYVEARVSAATIEIFHRGRRVASHPRSFKPGAHTTQSKHMPKSHRKHMEWTPSRILEWAATIGSATHSLVQAILEDRPHPEMGYRSCLGILRLSQKYGNDRLEAACLRSFHVNGRSFRSVHSILKNNLDTQPMRTEEPESPPVDHENIRGHNQYH